MLNSQSNQCNYILSSAKHAGKDIQLVPGKGLNSCILMENSVANRICYHLTWLCRTGGSDVMLLRKRLMMMMDTMQQSDGTRLNPVCRKLS